MSEIPPPPGGPADVTPPAGGPAEAPSPALEPSPPPPVPEEVPHDLSKRVEGVSCPSCGGGLELDTGLRVVSCAYCETPFVVLSAPGLRRLSVEPRIDAGRAREIARRWLGRGLAKDPRLERDARFGEAFLCFLPFFRVEADAVGFALGTETRTRTVGSGKNRRTETYEVDVERKVERSFDKTYPAVQVAEWGIQRVDLRGDPLVPYDARALAGQGMVFPATGSESETLAAAVKAFRESADPATGLSSVRFRFLETLRERLSVVYYPLWVLRYRFRRRSYQLLIDAEDGTLAYGKAPGNDLYRAAALVATQAAVAYFLTTALQSFGFNLALFAFLGGLGLAVFLWGWRRFRYGGVVIEGSGAAPADSLRGAIGSAARRRWRRR